MNPEVAIDLFKNVVVFALYIVGPFLAVTLTVGLLTSLIQAVTSLQEPTLTFAPKLVCLAVTLIALAPWLARSLSDFAVSFIKQMATLAT